MDAHQIPFLGDVMGFAFLDPKCVAMNEIEILIVEDNRYDADLTLRVLQKQNLANKIIHLSDGAEALDYIFAKGRFLNRDLNQMPRVIFLDLKMPKVNGLEVLQAIKADGRARSIPVVILTSSAEDPDIKQCYELGANSYIVKPVEFDTFAKVVSDLGFYWMVINKTL
ncbi:MAG TPA: response regulator [Cyclobacteriaceae bacterium]|nr:response regulator [Cyclobacteriaceae bacterium]